MKSKGSKIIVLTAVCLLAVAVVLAVIFIPKVRVNGHDTTTESGETQTYRDYTDYTVGGGKDKTEGVDFDKSIINSKPTYKTAEWNGFTVPAVFADVLTEAEKDTEAVIGNGAPLMTVRDIKVSPAELTSLFTDKYTSSMGQADENNFILMPNGAPSAMNYGYEEDYTWCDRFSDLSRTDLQNTYVGFYAALDEGFLPDDKTVETFNSSYQSNKAAIEKQYGSLEKGMESTYCENFTYSMLMRNMIASLYSSTFNSATGSAYSKKITDADLTKEYEENRKQYEYVDVRVSYYALEDDRRAAALSEIHDSDSFVDFFSNEFKDSGYSRNAIDLDTNWKCADYDTLVKNFGKNVAEWAFSDDRKAGDLGSIKEDPYERIVLVMKTKYVGHTVDVLRCDFPDQNSLSEAYNEYMKGEKTAEAFGKICEKYAKSKPTDVKNATHKDFEANTAEWVFSDDRKPGDCTGSATVSSSQDGKYTYYMLYFVSADKNNPDWKTQAKVNLITKYCEKCFEEVKNLNKNACTFNGKAISLATEAADKRCAQILKEKQEQISKTATATK